MNVDDALRVLLPLLYAAPIEPANWQCFLDRLSEITDVASGYLISSRPDTGNTCLAGGGPGYDPQAIALYNDRYGANDPFRAGFLARPRVGVIAGEELVRRSHLVKSELWNELLLPFELHHVTMLCGHCDAGGIDTLSLWRNARQGPLDSASIDLLQDLTPHVRTALLLNAQLRDAGLAATLSETALDALDMVVVLVDGRGHLQHMNRVAARRLPKLAEIAIHSGRLVAADPADDVKLQSLVQRATATSDRRGTGLSAAAARAGGAMKIRHPQTHAELHLSVIPTPAPIHIGARHDCATVFIGEPSSSPRLRGDTLRDLYGLTATEARLADCLLEGRELRGAAETLSITWSTARFHLKRIFAKTGTCRQTELMRLMLSLPGRTN